MIPDPGATSDKVAGMAHRELCAFPGSGRSARGRSLVRVCVRPFGRSGVRSSNHPPWLRGDSRSASHDQEDALRQLAFRRPFAPATS